MNPQFAIGPREVLQVEQHSDSNEVTLFWITAEQGERFPMPGRGDVGGPRLLLSAKYDAWVLAIFDEGATAPSVRTSPEWSAFFTRRRGEWRMLYARAFPDWEVDPGAGYEGLLHEVRRSEGYHVEVTPTGFQVVDVHYRPVDVPIEEYAAIDAMVARMRELLSVPRITSAITRAMRSPNTPQTEIRIA